MTTQRRIRKYQDTTMSYPQRHFVSPQVFRVSKLHWIWYKFRTVTDLRSLKKFNHPLICVIDWESFIFEWSSKKYFRRTRSWWKIKIIRSVSCDENTKRNHTIFKDTITKTFQTEIITMEFDLTRTQTETRSWRDRLKRPLYPHKNGISEIKNLTSFGAISFIGIFVQLCRFCQLRRVRDLPSRPVDADLLRLDFEVSRNMNFCKYWVTMITQCSHVMKLY